MTPNQYFLLAFTITMILLVGYPIRMWLEARSLTRSEARLAPGPAPPEPPGD